jgi:hypothetical protein
MFKELMGIVTLADVMSYLERYESMEKRHRRYAENYKKAAEFMRARTPTFINALPKYVERGQSAEWYESEARRYIVKASITNYIYIYLGELHKAFIIESGDRSKDQCDAERIEENETPEWIKMLEEELNGK